MNGAILITGGAGYIGTVLTEMLLAQGHRVIVFDRLYFGKQLLGPLIDHPRLTLIRADIREIDESHFANVSTVMHLAAISNDPACDLDAAITEDINFTGTLRTAQMAKKAGVRRFIFSSSCSVYGSGSESKLDEDSETHPVSLYAKYKVAIDKLFLDMADENFSVTVLRNATVYGLSYRMRFDLIINIMTLFAYSKRKIYVLGGGKQWRPLVHVRDVAKAFIMVMNSPVEKVNGQVFNVGTNEQNYQVQRIAYMVADVVPRTTIEVIPDDPDKRTYNCTFDKIANVLGFSADFTVMDGIHEVHTALERGQVDDDIRTKTVSFYRYLIDAQRVLDEVMVDGRIF